MIKWMRMMWTKLLCVNMRSMRPSAKGVGLSPSVYISVTTYNHPQCTQCSTTTLTITSITKIALYLLHFKVSLHCWLPSYIRHSGMRCIQDCSIKWKVLGCSKVVKWSRLKCILCWNVKWKGAVKWRRRGNGAYWIDGVEEAHRQMVPDQGNLTRNIIVIVIFKKILLEMIISDDDEA